MLRPDGEENAVAEGNTTLVGTWKLLAWELEFQDSDRRDLLGGTEPKGYVILTPEGRLMAVLTGTGRTFGQSDAEFAALFRSMTAYTGTYEVKGDQFITKVDVSWNEVWNGTDQVRNYKIEGNRLDIITAWQPHPLLPGNPIVRGILSWEREA
jgi:hypothetical protein